MPTAQSHRRGRNLDSANVCGHFQKKKTTADTFPMTASNGRYWPAVEGDSHRFKYWRGHSMSPPRSHTSKSCLVPAATPFPRVLDLFIRGNAGTEEMRGQTGLALFFHLYATKVKAGWRRL